MPPIFSFWTGRNETSQNAAPPPRNMTVRIYDYCSFKLADGTYCTHITGCVREPGRHRARNTIRRSLAGLYLGGVLPHYPASAASRNNLSWMTSPVVPHVGLQVKVRPAVHVHGKSSVCIDTCTDKYGRFSVKVPTSYAPHTAVARCTENPQAVQVQEISPTPPHGVSVISDIDDTVRHTGVRDGSRTAARNVLWQDPEQFVLPGVAQWYNQMYYDLGCSVHYVSNAPFQFYDAICAFLKAAGLPVTSILPRECLGSLRSVLYGLSVRSEDRKISRIDEIVRAAPQRGFVLIGDSGEVDLNAYAHIAATYSQQILAIYIRVVPGTFSSNSKKEKECVKVVQKMLDSRVSEFSSSSSNSSLSVSYPQPTTGSSPRSYFVPENSYKGKMKRWVDLVQNVNRLVPADIPVEFWWDAEEVREECLEQIQSYQDDRISLVTENSPVRPASELQCLPHSEELACCPVGYCDVPVTGVEIRVQPVM